MKITDLRIGELEGIMEYQGVFWEERLRMPTDIYPEYREMGPELMAKHPIPLEDGKYKVVLQFLQIETDEGLTGLSGPMFYPSSAFLIETTIKRHLIGKDPLRTELHWDIMYPDQTSQGGIEHLENGCTVKTSSDRVGAWCHRLVPPGSRYDGAGPLHHLIVRERAGVVSKNDLIPPNFLTASLSRHADGRG